MAQDLPLKHFLIVDEFLALQFLQEETAWLDREDGREGGLVVSEQVGHLFVILLKPKSIEEKNRKAFVALHAFPHWYVNW
jgi:hypothetical protein